MRTLKTLSAVFPTVILMATLGCASTRTHEGTGQYVDDSAITTKVNGEHVLDDELVDRISTGQDRAL